MRSVDQSFYQTTYTDQDISRICRQTGIGTSQHSFVKSELEHFAAIWRSNKARFSGPELTPHQVSATLKKVVRQADKLSDLVESLPNAARRALRIADDDFMAESPVDDGRDRTEAGQKITRFTNQDGEETMLIDDLDDLLWSVEALAAVAQRAASKQHAPAKGPRYSIANGVWVSNVAGLWENHLKREFTRDVLTSGEPISDASLFCVQAFNILSPSVQQSTILNLMKKHIRNKRQKPTGKVST